MTVSQHKTGNRTVIQSAKYSLISPACGNCIYIFFLLISNKYLLWCSSLRSLTCSAAPHLGWVTTNGGPFWDLHVCTLGRHAGTLLWLSLPFADIPACCRLLQLRVWQKSDDRKCDSREVERRGEDRRGRWRRPPGSCSVTPPALLPQPRDAFERWQLAGPGAGCQTEDNDEERSGGKTKGDHIYFHRHLYLIARSCLVPFFDQQPSRFA